MTDPFDDELRNTGLDPSPDYQAQLESILTRAYDGTPPHRDRKSSRALVIGAAAAVIVASIVGVVALSRTSGRKTIVDAPTTTVAPGPTSTTAPPTSSSVPTTIGITTTAAPDAADVTHIDLGEPASPLAPTTIATYPIVPPGDLYATAIATVASRNRIAVLDTVTGELRFVDGNSGDELSHFSVGMSTLGSAAFIGNEALVGPDDVLYLAEVNASVPGDSSLVAFAPRGDVYIEVARQPAALGDAAMSLGRTGIALRGAPDETLMPYVGLDGQPSGATLEIDEWSADCRPGEIFTYGRAGRTWRLALIHHPDVGPPSEPCSSSSSPRAELGPRDTMVLSNYAPQPDGDIKTRYTILDKDITSYDTDWTYVGATDDALVFSHLDQDSIDIGIMQI